MEQQLIYIQNKIYEIKEQRVILDYDLATMYQVETWDLNQSVKCNIEHFPLDFMFQLLVGEWEILTSQIVISSWGCIRKLSYAFTEQGIAMLSRLLNNAIAIEMNIKIMRAFVFVRQYALGYAKLNRKLEDFMYSINKQFNGIYQALTELAEQKRIAEKPHPSIGYLTEEQRKNLKE
jgi:hypothetical protein